MSNATTTTTFTIEWVGVTFMKGFYEEAHFEGSYGNRGYFHKMKIQVLSSTESVQYIIMNGDDSYKHRDIISHGKIEIAAECNKYANTENCIVGYALVDGRTDGRGVEGIGSFNTWACVYL